MCRAVSEVRSSRGGGVARDAEGSVLEQPNALAKTSKYSNARRESSRTPDRTSVVLFAAFHCARDESQWVLSL
jgi:hypothetical protein